MADKLDNYAVLDFSGGVRRDLWYKEFQKNELLDTRNVEIQKGRLVTRRGAQQTGDTLTGTLENSFTFVGLAAGSPNVYNLVNNFASPVVISNLLGTRLTSAVTISDTTINVVSSASFANSGTIEIDGDLIAYTGKGAGTFTGVTGITSAHLSGRAVHQWITVTQSGTGVDGRNGVYYAVLNNILIFGGRGGNLKQMDNAGTVTDITGEPSILGLTNYRDRIYGFGDASAGTNGDARRISFSNLGDGTTWTTGSDFFDVEDQRGEYITALKLLNDKLLIFKYNSTFTYDEIELKQRLFTVGAYNTKVIQEIDGIVYTFCPNGVFVTDGFQVKNIGEPIQQYLNNFLPQFDATTSRIVINCCAGKFKNKYILYLFDITDPVSEADVCLEYDILRKAWTVYQGNYTNIFHFGSFNSFRFGDRSLNILPGLFTGGADGKYFRHYENKYLDNQSTPVIQGTNLYQNLLSNTGTPISAVIETPLYDLTHPNLWKTFKHLRVYAEQGAWQISYRIVNEKGLSEYKPMGEIRTTEKVIKFPTEATGWRIGLKFTSINSLNTAIFNGFVFENTEVTKRD